MTTIESTSSAVVPQWTLGDRLRKARTVADVAVEAMAEDIGRSDRTIRNYESDATVAPLLVVRQYALRTGVDVRWLLGIPDTSGDEGVVTLRYVGLRAA